MVAEVAEKVEEDDYEQLAKDLENASPLEIMDKALAKFGNDIAIAFRYCLQIFCCLVLILLAITQ